MVEQESKKNVRKEDKNVSNRTCRRLRGRGTMEVQRGWSSRKPRRSNIGRKVKLLIRNGKAMRGREMVEETRVKGGVGTASRGKTQYRKW